MACSIKFVRLNDFAADIDVLDLSADGYSLDRDGYFPVVAPIGAKSVHEVLTLKLQGTSKDDLATMTQDIDEKIKQVQWWIDAPGVERYQVWMRVQLENETYPRQAQLLNITPPDKLRVFVPEEINDNYIGAYSLGIERTPFWEDPYPYPTTTSKTDIDSIGGMVQLSETINGDVPARLAYASIHRASGLAKTWFGFRTSRFGNPAVFKSVWPLSIYNFLLNNTAETTDATAYSGTRLTTTLASSPTLLTRVKTSLFAQDNTNYNEQRGVFTVLLRASVTSGTARVRLLYGWEDRIGLLSQPIYRSLTPISGSSWNLYSLGQMSIPPMRARPSSELAQFSAMIQAEQVTGSGDLYLDCLILIPYAEGSISLIDYQNGAYLSSYTLSNGDTFAQNDSPPPSITVYSAIPPVASPDFGLPANNEAPYIVVASQRIDQSVLADKADFIYTYIPRWRTLRGSVT